MRLRLLALLALLCTLAACGNQTPKEYAWQRIDTTVDVRMDGTLHVTEAMTMRFISGTFSFVERDLPYRNLDSIDEIAVESSEHSFVPGSRDEPYTFSVKEMDGFKRIRMNYPPATSGTRTVRLSYRVAGAVQRDYFPSYSTSEEAAEDARDEHQQVWWSMVFPQRDRPVEHATGRINLPKALAAGEFSAEAPNVQGTVERFADGASIEATNVPAGQELTLRVLFPRLIEDDYHMPYFSQFTADGAANRALPEEEAEPSPLAEFFSDPRLFFGVIFLVGIMIYNIRRWLNGEYEEPSDYERGYSDGYRRSSRYRSSSSSSSSSSRSRSSSSSRRGGGASGGGGGRVG